MGHIERGRDFTQLIHFFIIVLYQLKFTTKKQKVT
jgi:hypothetical protein